MHNNWRLGKSFTLFKLVAHVKSARTAWGSGQDIALLIDTTVKKYVAKLNSPDFLFFAGHFVFLSIVLKYFKNGLAIIMKQLAVVTETCYINRYTKQH